jgi:hypothetical protein
MILGGVRDIKYFYIIEMPSRKTSRRGRQTKRKTYRRRSVKRGGSLKTKRGGVAANQCAHYRQKLNEFINRLQDATPETIMDLYQDIRIAHREARRAGCIEEANAMDNWEVNIFTPRMNAMMR